MILNSRFSIDSLRISLINCPLSEVVAEIKSIAFNTFTKKWQQNDYQLKGSSELSAFVTESDSDIIKCLIWQPLSVNFDLVVFISNMSDGWQSLIDIYFNKFKREIIRIELSDCMRSYPYYSFEYMNMSGERFIRSMKDSDKWKFLETGSAMQFEDTANYKKRKIADRINNGIIIDYLKKKEIDITNDNFWVSKGNAIEFSTKLN